MSILTVADILQAALKLPRSDRELIARELWDSMPPPGALSEDDPGFFEELDRRREALRSGADPGMDAFEAVGEIEAELDSQGGR
jgi:putative addiction module component (TIGR02574 family)